MSRWISSAINGIASLWGVHQQNKNIDKQLSAQAAENRKMREYNLMLAKQQNQWNLEQWNRENAYNSPSAQMERMRQAGLNPDMMYGGGVSGNLAASSPSMTSGSSAPPMDWSSLANKATVADALDSQLKQAQIDNINADTRKKGSEVSILASDAKYRDAWNQGLIDTQNVRIELDRSSRDLNVANASKAMRETQAIDASVAHINKQIEQIDRSMDIQERLSDAQIKQIAADVGLTYEQINRMARETPRILRSLDDKHEIDLLGLGRLRIENGVAKFQAEMHGAFNDSTERDMRLSDQCLKGLTRLIDAFRGNPYSSADIRK